VSITAIDNDNEPLARLLKRKTDNPT